MHMYSTGSKKPCCVGVRRTDFIQYVYKWYISQKEGDTHCLTCRPARESILRARDVDNNLVQYGILLSIMEADFLNTKTYSGDHGS